MALGVVEPARELEEGAALYRRAAMRLLSEAESGRAGSRSG